jgi:hypothetical protein
MNDGVAHGFCDGQIRLSIPQEIAGNSTHVFCGLCYREARYACPD